MIQSYRKKPSLGYKQNPTVTKDDKKKEEK